MSTTVVNILHYKLLVITDFSAIQIFASQKVAFLHIFVRLKTGIAEAMTTVPVSIQPCIVHTHTIHLSIHVACTPRFLWNKGVVQAKQK